MECRVTAKIKIDRNKLIDKTLKIYKKGLQFCINVGWNKHIKNNVRLHPFVYRDLKEMGLQSQLAVACIKQACGMLKRAKSKPTINNISMRYNFPRSASIQKGNVLSLATIDGRVKIPFTIPECFSEYFDNWKIRESLLRVDKQGRCFFLFTFSKQVDTSAVSSTFHKANILGIDLGINKLAVTSDGNFFGKWFKHKRRQIERIAGELQSKGTSASRQRLKKVWSRWQRLMSWTNHNISREIVDSLNKGDVIVMEDLSYIRRTARWNKWVHKWNFRQLQEFIEYKALRKGCRVVYVNPSYTSKTCNRCHSLNTSRHDGFFECNQCGHTLDSDLNGARNIARRYQRITGLEGTCKRAYDLTSNDAKASV